jgi:ligand-binding sensor domain-containing protein
MSDVTPIVFVVDDDITVSESLQLLTRRHHRKMRLSTPRARSLLAAFYLFAAGWMTAVDAVWALDTSKPISQYAHSSWRTDDGFYIGSPTTITQTADGYLWIGTNLGLVRFDGVRFAQWQPPPGERLLDPRVFSLLGSRDGSLWIGTGYSLSRWKDGHLTNYPTISGRIESLLEDADGAVWLARTQSTDGLGPVCRVKSEQVTCYSKSDQVPFPNVLQLAKSDDQTIWLAGYSELCRWKPGTSSIYFPNLTNRQEGFALFRSLATGPDGSTWAVIDHPGTKLSLQHSVQEHWHEQVFSDIPVKNSQVTSLFVDQKNGLWIGTSTQGVFRVQGDRTEHFGESDGLSSNSVQSIYQDEEGDVWVVTSVGIDNFRDRSVSSYSMREGLDADGAAAVLASRSGAVWVLSSYATVQKLENGRFSEFLPRPGMPVHHVTTLFEDHLGRMWFGLEGGLYVYDKDVFRPILHTDGTPLGIVFSITEDTRQRIWVRAGSNLDRIDDFTLREERTSPQISTAYILAATPDGGVILGLVDGELLKYKDGKEQSIPSNGIGSRTQIRDLLVEPDGTVWGTTLNELFSIRGSTRKNLNRSNGLPCDGIFALVEDDAKAIWLYSQCGLIRISRSDLNQWGQHPDTVLHPQLIDEGDGVQPGLTSLKPQASRAPDGRLWFVNGRTLQTIDADHLKVNLTPPVVHIEAARADLREYSPVEGLHLPALTRDLEIDYTAISFVAPQKVRFRSLNYRSRASVSVYQPRPSFHAPVVSKSASLRRFPMLLSVNL